MEPVRKAPFSEKDIQLLQFELRKIPEDGIFAFLTLTVGLFVVLGFGFRHHISFFEQFGIWKGAFFIICLSAGTVLIAFGSKRRRFQKDLLGGVKFIRNEMVIDKQKSFSSKKQYIWIGSRKPENRYEVAPSVYQQLQKGQSVSLEYAPYSKVILHIQWV
ncbi:MAG: hypothetical protein IT261_06085 [Saprospiraceae bacterium]|nr:hypothetical protein [Saprospiraceae bacterium]